MKWKKLVDYEEGDILSRGTLFRLMAKWPYEEIVDFMLVDYPDPEASMTIIVTSGYKGGLVLVSLPKDAYSNSIRAIDCQWLKSNWAEWVYPECSVNDVYICDGYPIPDKYPPE